MKKLLGIVILGLLFSSSAFAGCIKGDCKNGYGEYVYSNGDKYFGNHSKGKKSGQGKYLYSGGDIYEGSFRKDKYHGYGVYKDSDGSLYEGEWKNDDRHGQGKQIFANGKNAGQIWEGKWRGNSFYGEKRKTNVTNNVNNANISDMIQNAKNTCKSLGFNEGTEKPL